MPLHLLGKKSWNVYNADNVARVRRDEAAAKAAEAAEEQRMQEIDAERRLAILRGEAPPPLIEEGNEPTEATRHARGPSSSSHPRKRKRHGEDDTDFELRLAKERNDASSRPSNGAQKVGSSGPIVDSRGHIDLFGDEKTRARAEKNEEAEREAQKKKREHEDQFTMRLSNAAGKDGIKRPWYSQGIDGQEETRPKNIWGNYDPMRKQRDASQIAANDPLAAMKKGASRVRELKREREKLQDERAADLDQLRKEERQRGKHRRREERRSSASPRRRHRSKQASHDEDGEGNRRRRERSRERSSRRSARH